MEFCDFAVWKQNCYDSEVIECCCALRKHLRKLWAVIQIEKKLAFWFYNFTMLPKAEKKRLLKLAEHSELNSFKNVVAEIDIDALKI